MIKQVDGENLFKEVVSLKGGEKIYIDADNELCDRWDLAIFQKKSYENLFVSYINNTIEEANNIKLTEFLKEYTDLCLKENDIFKEILVKAVGKDIYLHMLENKIKFILDYQLKTIQIFR